MTTLTTLITCLVLWQPNFSRPWMDYKDAGMAVVSSRPLPSRVTNALRAEPKELQRQMEALKWQRRKVEGFTYWLEPDFMGLEWRERALSVGEALLERTSRPGARIKLSELPEPVRSQTLALVASIVNPEHPLFGPQLLSQPDLGVNLNLEQTFTLSDGNRTVSITLPMSMPDLEDLNVPTSDTKPAPEVQPDPFVRWDQTVIVRPHNIQTVPAEEWLAFTQLLQDDVSKFVLSQEAKLAQRANSAISRLASLFAKELGDPSSPNYNSLQSLSSNAFQTLRGSGAMLFRQLGFQSAEEFRTFFDRSQLVSRSSKLGMGITVQTSRDANSVGGLTATVRLQP